MRLPIALLSLALFSSAALAGTCKPRLDRAKLAPRTCGTGKLVVDVVQQVLNDADRGRKGNFWALDDYRRAIKVWRIAPHNFCAIVTYDGTFRTFAGRSPGGTGTIGAGIKGHFSGGYRMDFSGSLRERPLRRAQGSIGTVDYRCSSAGKCPGSVYWVKLYFTNVTGDDFDWWGWLYRTSKNGAWLNAVTGTECDIVGAGKG